MTDDPLQRILLKVVISFMMAVGIVFFLKPLLVIAAGFFVCSVCEETTMIIITAILFSAAVMVPIYKMVSVFYQ